MSASAAEDGRSRPAAGRRAPQLSSLQIGVLAAVGESPVPVGAYPIVKELRSLFPETSVYNAMPQMADAGLLRSEEIEGARGPKRGYCCTPEGLQALKRWAKWPPTKLVAPSTEMLLWLSAVRVRHPKDVLRGIEALEEVLYEQELELKLAGSRTRRAKGWNTHAELEYELERAAVEASRQFLALAKGLYEERVAALSTSDQRPRRK
jgi:DNA-binding PadR family transcriptional regulator